MENKIFKLQIAAFKALEEIFYSDDVKIFTSGADIESSKNFIHIESVKKEREGGNYDKFTINLKFGTNSASASVISKRIEKIEHNFTKEVVEKFLLTNFTSFNLIECSVFSNKYGDFAGNIIIICFF